MPIDAEYLGGLGALITDPETLPLGMRPRAEGTFGLGAIGAVPVTKGLGAYLPKGDIARMSKEGKPQRGAVQSLAEVRALVEQHGPLYVRWSRGPEFDMKPGAVSKDYQSGKRHQGLSAVRIDADMPDSVLYRMLRDYGYLRSKKNPAGPHLYAGKTVGRDSDNADSITPTQYLGSLSDDFVSFIDDDENLRRLQLTEQIEQNRRALEHYKKEPPAYIPVWTEDTLKALERELASLKTPRRKARRR